MKELIGFSFPVKFLVNGEQYLSTHCYDFHAADDDYKYFARVHFCADSDCFIVCKITSLSPEGEALTSINMISEKCNLFKVFYEISQVRDKKDFIAVIQSFGAYINSEKDVQLSTVIN